MNSPHVLISLSSSRNQNIKNSATRQMRLTHMTNSRAVAYKNWIARCFPPPSRVLLEAKNKLVKTFSIAFFLNFYYIFIIYDYLTKRKKKRTKSNKEEATSKKRCFLLVASSLLLFVRFFLRFVKKKLTSTEQKILPPFFLRMNIFIQDIYFT